MLRIFLNLVIVFSFIPCIAQQEGNTWVFGDSAGIIFNNSNATPLLGTILSSYEGSSSISDINGNLLFYSGYNMAYGLDSLTVINKFHKVILNGTGIYGSQVSTSAQGCLLLPDPGDNNKIYLITHRQKQSPFDYKIYYSIIDKTLNSDSGAVILKNIPLPGIDNFMAEQMQAIRHGNGKDWWLITHQGSTDQFYKYLIDSSGVNGPYIQSIGTILTSNNSIMGNIKFSPDGERLVLVAGSGIVDLYNFDRCTGTISNLISLGTNSPGFNISKYGCSFSTSSQILYVSDVDIGLYQYDLLSSNIQASKQTIWLKPNLPYLETGQHLLAPDNKIYIASIHSGQFSLQNMNLSVINSPDSLGLVCDFQPYSFYLGGRRSFYGLPNIPDYSLLAVEGGCVVSVEEVGISKNDFVLFPNPANDELNIAVKSSHEKISVKVFNILGEEVLSSAFTNQINIDISSFTAGIYLVKLCNEKNEFVYAEKIIIQK
jgi:hypothetical protein